MNSDIQNWKKLLEAISLERDEEINFHRNEIKELSPQEREKRGRAILDLKANHGGFVLGERTLTDFIKKNNTKQDRTDIRRGDVIRISKMDDPEKEIALGTVWSISKKISIATDSKFPIDKKCLYRIDLAANDITYKRMESAMEKFYENVGPGRRTREKIFKKENRWARFSKKITEPEYLNESQKKAWEIGLKTAEISFIHGPPGTGKTTVATHIACSAANERKDHVLICAPSNTAIDNIAFKLLEFKNKKFLRIGHPARMDQELEKYSLDYKLANTEDRQIIKLRTEAKLAAQELQEIKHPGRSLIRGLSDEEIISLGKRKANTRGLRKNQIKILQNWVYSKKKNNSKFEKLHEEEDKFKDKKIKEARIVLATCSTCGSEVLENHNFDLCILDEASQAPVPLALIPMLISGKTILVGDGKQLSPVVKNREAIKLGLKNTLFEHVEKEKPSNGKMLKIQYRMRDKILSFPNSKWYKNKIKSAEKVFKYKNTLKRGSPIGQSEITAIDTNGLFKENLTKEDHSWKNLQEVQYIAKIIGYLEKEKIKLSNIGVISPYKAQAKELKKISKDIEVHTVDGFQGREKDLIIISLVRSNKNKNIGFLSDEKRLNVSLTRAKKHLVVIGDRNTFSENKIFNELWQFIEKNGNCIKLKK